MGQKILSAEEARRLILDGDAPSGIVVEGPLDLSGQSKLDKLPTRLTCYELDASGTGLTSIPKTLSVECVLALRDCAQLTSLPAGLQVGTLDVAGCTALKKLPNDFEVWFLNARGCTALTRFPDQARILHGGLNVSGCVRLEALPDYLGRIATLDISDCPQIGHLPKALLVQQWADIADSGVTNGVQSPQPQLADCRIRWRGVTIDEYIAYRPESITSKKVLKEKNAERRRVMIERMGFQKFMSEAGAKVIDKDTDPGGARELLRLPLEGDEDIVCLSCFCPSTQRHYLLRVPPNIKGCHQAAAWMAGFDDPADYQPVMET